MKTDVEYSVAKCQHGIDNPVEIYYEDETLFIVTKKWNCQYCHGYFDGFCEGTEMREGGCNATS